MVLFTINMEGFFVLTFIENGTVLLKTYVNRMQNFRESQKTFIQDILLYMTLQVIKLFSEKNVLSKTKVKKKLGVSRFSYAMRHNDARGWGIIANDVLKMRKAIEFQSICPATAHLWRRSISRNSNRQVI